ncbi:hypothetical protein E3N88_42367 [Mikania micrantha]|uniref:Kinesin motor domain-containing protein n=1 Tax=Mikania micrantha TaxID=192012 RepID=A0A5N6LI17_9ASTR|nr:hypothetical protein E3N88_42367 [Mikania micrantha]
MEAADDKVAGHESGLCEGEGGGNFDLGFSIDEMGKTPDFVIQNKDYLSSSLSILLLFKMKVVEKYCNYLIICQDILSQRFLIQVDSSALDVNRYQLTMPHIYDSLSEFKTRFGQQEHCRPYDSSQPPVRSTPDLLKSVMKETPYNTSAISSFRDRGECSSVSVNLNDSFEFREDPAFWKDHNVQVIIRVRPLSSSEMAVQGPSRCVKQGSSQTITWTGPPEARFTFDHVADEHVSQEMLFKVAGVPMVENCMGGYNSCMFAYGQTGSGKTHTMLGDIDGGSRRHSVNSGMTPRVFEYLEARREEKIQYTCKCSFLEIYNEQILDLLDPSSTNLQIREDTKKGVYVDNLKEIEVTSARDVIQLLIQGAANRKVASTNMNCASSRSHSVFTCIIESKWLSQGVTHHRFARLNLVDLAGSERQKGSGAEGERLKEATNINKSLSTLGLVIMNLVNVSNGKSLHVPYRDSKLTFLLQDSLGGNSKTTIIANISPSSCNSLETLSTLKFAQRAKFIKNHATINEDASGDVLAMRTQIQQLKNEVSRLQSVISGGTENNADDAWTLSFPGSPGSFKWERIHGSFSPVTAVKRISNKKEYEMALVGAFRREKDKDITLQALTAESQAAQQLAKQREDEIQGLKMRLRFREAAIKRLEGVASGKISAETHLLKEKEEHLKELDVLRSQVDRNQELLEALDWKLMHETQPAYDKKPSFDFLMDNQRDGDFFSLKDPTTPHCTEKTQIELPLVTTPNVTHISDQRELQAMVDAIAAASQREAEAHETAIILSKENDELRAKLKMLIDDNNKLIEIYDHANTHVYEGNKIQINDLHEDNLVEVHVNDDRSPCLVQTSELVDPDEQIVKKLTFCDETNHVDNRNVNLCEKLDKLQEMLLKSSENASSFTSLERQIIDIDRLSRNIQKVKDDVLVKQKDYTATNILISDLKEQESMLERKLTALRFSMSNFSKSLGYFEQREAHARAKSLAASSNLKSKKNELTRILTMKDEHECALSKLKQSETELKNNIAALKLKTEEENMKRENDKVLLAIDNVKWKLAGKATELLKFEEEKTKQQLQMKQDEEKLMIIKKESEKTMRKLHDLDQEKQAIEFEIQKGTMSMEETESKLQSNSQEKQIVLDMKESGKTEIDNIFVEFQETVFRVKLKEEEKMILSEEMEMGMKRLEGLEFERSVCMQKMSEMVDGTTGRSLSGNMVEDLEIICSSFMELKLVFDR